MTETEDELGRGATAIRALQGDVKRMEKAFEKQDKATTDARADANAHWALLMDEMRVLSRDNVATQVREEERHKAELIRIKQSENLDAERQKASRHRITAFITVALFFLGSQASMVYWVSASDVALHKSITESADVLQEAITANSLLIATRHNSHGHNAH